MLARIELAPVSRRLLLARERSHGGAVMPAKATKEKTGWLVALHAWNRARHDSGAGPRGLNAKRRPQLAERCGGGNKPRWQPAAAADSGRRRGFRRTDSPAEAGGVAGSGGGGDALRRVDRTSTRLSVIQNPVFVARSKPAVTLPTVCWIFW